MSGFHFAQSAVLNWLWLLPALYFLLRFLSGRYEKRISSQFNVRLKNFLTASLSNSKRIWKLRLEIVTLALFILAYARPQGEEGRQKVKNEGIEILFLMDVSNSMLAEDIKPSRLELAKSELNRFINLSAGDRMGLVAFAGSAMLLSPMTTDQEAIRMYIDSIDTNVVSTQGTDLANALKEAHEAFKRGGLGEQESTQVTRALVITSDGEEHEPGAYEEARKLVKDGIHIFSLAIGTEGGAPIPLRDDQGILRGYKKGENGKEVLSKTKGTVLKELAKIGEGAFYHATFQGSAIENIRADIDLLKKAEFEAGEVSSYNELFQYLLWLGFAFALFELWLSERKRKGRIWKGRFEVAGD